MASPNIDILTRTPTEAFQGNTQSGGNPLTPDQQALRAGIANIAALQSPVPTLPVNLTTAAEQLQQAGSRQTPQNIRNDRHEQFLESNPFAVRLKSFLNKDVVAFRVSPEISETRTASYKSLDPIHLPGSVQIFTNTAPRTWSMSGIKLISRNGNEAEENLATVNQLRSWMVPFFGDTNTQGKDGYTADLLGAPPEVLQFSAYSNLSDKNMTNIRNIPVVMTSLSIPYPTDVDYIRTSLTNQPFPAVMNVDILLMETHSPREFSNFNLLDYRKGTLPGF